MVKFLSQRDKEQVMEKAKCLKGTKIFFLSEDYPASVRQKRKELIPAMREKEEK